MKKISLCLMIIMLFSVYSFSTDAPEQNLPSDFYLRKNTPESNTPESLAVYMPDTIKRIMLRSDTIGIFFKDDFVLYFDCANLKIIKEKNYFAALKDETFFREWDDLIIDKEGRYSEFVCRKKSPGAAMRGIIKQKNQRPKSDIRKVKFGNQFILYWDCANHKLMEDEIFFSILQNKENIYSIAHFITDKEIVCDFVCGKDDIPEKSPPVLRKGDIAYLFLSEYHNKLISDNECLGGSSFTSFYPGCKYNGNLLDYIERNRNLVFQKVMSCLDRQRTMPATGTK